MLRDDPTGPYLFPFQEQFSNWRDEQTAWATTATLFDQSFHMNDIYFTGPDVKRLFSESAVNNFVMFGRNRAKQLVAVNPAGDYIGDGIVFGFEDDQYVLVGTPAASDWIAFRAKSGGYDVEVEADPASPFNPNPRRKFRYQLQGPRSLDIIRKAAGDAVDHIRFFRMGEFQIAGVPIRALNHTMVGVPGQEYTGLEMTGPVAESQRVLDALAAAGEEFGMRQGGSLAYSTTAAASGWWATPVPAVYLGDELRAYRQHLPGDGFEAHASVGGSLESDDIRDYYLTPGISATAASSTSSTSLSAATRYWPARTSRTRPRCSCAGTTRMQATRSPVASSTPRTAPSSWRCRPLITSWRTTTRSWPRHADRGRQLAGVHHELRRLGSAWPHRRPVRQGRHRGRGAVGQRVRDRGQAARRGP